VAKLGVRNAARLADALARTSQELERIRVLGLRVEQTICAIAVRAAIDSAVVAELQHLDALIQHVAALRDFTEQVAVECSDDVSIDLAAALERITLADVRRRLGDASADQADERWEIL
jgi:hypothetical protein